MHCVFEGPIGAGKTTFAQLYANHVGNTAKLFLEGFADNPFLEDYYRHKDRWALPMQLTFLMLRSDQLAMVPRSAGGIFVADHSMRKDKVFAELILRDREKKLYEHVASKIVKSTFDPDLVVYLDAPTNVLLGRIKKRDRSYEAGIDADYLDSIREAYEPYISSLPSNKLMRIDTSGINLDSVEQIEQVLKNIDKQLISASR